MKRRQYKNMPSAYSCKEFPPDEEDRSWQKGSPLYVFQSQTNTNKVARLAVSRFVGDGKEDERALLFFPYWTNSRDKNDLSPKPSNWNDITHLGRALTSKFIWDRGADRSQQIFDFQIENHGTGFDLKN